MNNFRIGQGYDVHQLVKDRPLIIGGITIPGDKGALGHSDADVLLHAIADALLGAVGMGDLGIHFPDQDEKIKGIQSTKILSEVGAMIKGKGYRIGNIDSTVILQKPKIAAYIPLMINQIAQILQTEKENISVKATTTEHLGFEGKGEGIAAVAIALVYKA